MAAVVVVGAAAFVWWTRPTAQPVAPAPSFSTAASAPADVGVALVVAVGGKVKTPGLVRLTPGSRVADAITAAGGVLPGTDLTGLNLARKVVDGELITVGAPAGGAAGGGGVAGGGGGVAGGGKVNLNLATLAQLDGLPGVGPVLAQRIIDWRDKRGGFRSVTDLRQVEGIGEAKFDDLKELVTV
ncbi:competence protein ComEA [Allocatelliglobosispora scoriae]|uniref:Competence protein ComEA n=1 Tax=Allocatelliglobosispora scoriae TaxID=643052 RepID=A0A841BT22_9ACTN|nr:competence protein ComEA [Allocatelliglobosispora scoriae]